ncbi:Rubrofusarin-specific efflux pump aurT [Colletotrichum sp. SAR 10_65]|nr:Rubrofusarin-specific efflux pump aurT [Colletotrichum sp. SAR 10_65]KAI8201192.1 Rubrofusarin-specific efflux pump aurT [Colletotrichum sp. SAR 10_76]
MSDIHDQEGSSFPDEKFATKPPSEANEEGNDESQYPQGLKLAVIILSNMIAMFLVALDRTIITTAIPHITDDFHSLNDVSWYASAYLITSCATQLLWGRIFTFYSTKAVYLIAIFLFELGSLLCGVAPNSVAFIIGRAIAGAGSAGIYSGSTILITSVTPLHKRAGLPVGGVAVAALIALFPKLSPKEPTPLKQQIRQLDPLGNLVFLPGVICLILALQWGGEKYPWNSGRIIALLVLAGVLLIVFVSIQIWQRENATVPPRLFTVRNIWLGAVFSFCLGAVLIVFLVALPIWFQGIRGTDAVTSGIDTLPLVLALVFGAMVSGAIINGIGWFNPVFFSSVIFMSVGGGLISTFGVHTPTHTWIGYQIILGLGIGQDEDMVFIASPPAEGIDPKASREFLDLFHFNFGDLMRWVTDPDTGDTAMHVAARMGRLDIINAAWQHFWQVIDWDKVPDKPGSEVYAPIDYDLPEFEIDVDLLWVPDYMVATVLFSRKNVSGHTTADEATTAGYTDVADRLNQALDRVTLGGKKATKSRMARMRELVNGRYDIDGHHLTWDQIPRVGLYYPPKYRS